MHGEGKEREVPLRYVKIGVGMERFCRIDYLQPFSVQEQWTSN